jgi:serine/threonine-protein kinase
MVGTPGFMAPEQILGGPIDGRADLYALGFVAWWLLTGNEVFAREAGDAKLLQRHITDPLPNLRERVPGWLPRDLEAILASCLAKDPEGRPRDARVLAALLRAIEIPSDHVWDETRAALWWRDYRAPDPAPTVASTQLQVALTFGPPDFGSRPPDSGSADTRVEVPHRARIGDADDDR